MSTKPPAALRPEALPPSLVATAVRPDDPDYARYRSGYMRGAAPGLVLRPANVEQVGDAVRFAAGHREVPLGILSAGHGLSGRSLNHGGIVIDVGAFRGIEVLDPEAGLVRIGPAARWFEVARELAPHGLAISSGDYGGVGVGGIATSGGLGLLAREHGLTIDHLSAVELVLADGTAVRADAGHHPDLFWAVRGAGANFGVVTAFEFGAPRVGKVAFARFTFDASDTAGFLRRWGEALERAPRRVGGEVILGAPFAGRQYAQALLVVDSDDERTIVADLQPIVDVAPLLDQQVVLAGYDQVMAALHSDAPQRAVGEPLSRSGLIGHLHADFAADAAALLAAGATHFFQIRSVGGAVADVPADATAYGWRDANFSVAAFGSPASGLDAWWERLLPHFEGLYTSFETTTGEEVLARAFPPGHLSRLRELKRRYDPTGLFRDSFFIPPAG